MYYKVFFLLMMLSFAIQLKAHDAIQNDRYSKQYLDTTVEELYQQGKDALDQENWAEASRLFGIVVNCFKNSSCTQEAFFYLGIANYYLREYDVANEAFSRYLKEHNDSKYFFETIEYKFHIAENLKNGAKRRLLKSRQLPKWASGKSLALEIYDEVICAMPSHEMAARALFAKGLLLWEMKEYHESVENFQLIIKRFPKNELAPQSYVLIAKIYFDQSKNEFQNPDILAFAQINLRKYKKDFPRDEEISIAEEYLLKIKEVYAKGLYDTGQFYERIKKPNASIIYYQNAICQFPETNVAQLCRERLFCLCPNLFEHEIQKNSGNENPELNDPALLQNS